MPRARRCLGSIPIWFGLVGLAGQPVQPHNFPDSGLSSTTRNRWQKGLKRKWWILYALAPPVPASRARPARRSAAQERTI